MNWKRILCIFGHRYHEFGSYVPMPDNKAAYRRCRDNRCSRCGHGDDWITTIETGIVEMTPVSEEFARRMSEIYQGGGHDEG